MLKKAALALFGIVLAVTLIAPPKASAQVHVGVRIGSPEPQQVVVVQPAPYVEYNEAFFVSHNWNSGFHDGYYYSGGQRYRRDNRGVRHYDNKYRDGRRDRDQRARGHHDNGNRGNGNGGDRGHGER